MQNLADNVREEVVKLVPSSILDDIACFEFYDDHPVQRKFCDIIICTKHGEVKEYYKRELVASLLLRSNFKGIRLRIVRDTKCQLYYLIASDHEVVILSRRESIKIHQRVSNIETYDIDDYSYNGQACLKIVKKDDAVPLVFDDKFQRLSDQTVFMDGVQVDDSMPLLIDLKRKLIQTRYSIACNLKTQKKLQDMRKLATFAAYEDMHPSLDDSMFHQNYKQKFEALKLQSKTPSVKICNQKIVIVLQTINKNKQVLNDVSVLLHAKNNISMVYTTKLFQRKITSPFWVETPQTMQCEFETAVVVVVDINQLQYNVPGKIEFNGVISYKRLGKECLLPFDYIVIPYSESMGSKIDTLANEIDEYSVLAVMASSEKVDLSLRVIRNPETDTRLSLPHLFWEHLGMEHVKKAINIVIHKKSSHHVLNGVMVIFDRDEKARNTYSMAVYARSSGQIVTLINYIHDAIPFRIVVTSKSHIITSATDALVRYKEEIPRNVHFKDNYLDYAMSLLRQIRIIREYLDKCIVKMNCSKSIETQSQIGKQIDLFGDGLAVFAEFRTALLDEAMIGVVSLKRTQLSAKDAAKMFQGKA